MPTATRKKRKRKKARKWIPQDFDGCPKGRYTFESPITGVAIRGQRRWSDHLFQAVNDLKAEVARLKAVVPYKAAWEDLVFLISSMPETKKSPLLDQVEAIRKRHLPAA